MKIHHLLVNGLAALCGLLAAAPAQAQSYGFSVLAGDARIVDHTDGQGTNARLLNPTGAAIDGAGNIYVADSGDHTIRKISSGGAVTTLAGVSGQPGSNDGTGAAARFNYPFAIAVTAGGTVYVTDIGDHTVRRITPDGTVATIAGSVGVAGNANGVGTSALFSYPQGIAVDASGNVYVADTDNNTIRLIAPNGVVSTFAGAAGQFGSADGNGGNARFNAPAGLAVDPSGNVIVADFGNSTIRHITPSGTVTHLAGFPGLSGAADGANGAARFDHPAGVATDAAGNVYVADTSNQTIRKIVGGVVSTVAGDAGVGGHADGTSATFFYAFGITSDTNGVLYVADTGNHTIRRVGSTGTSTFAGAVGVPGSNDGTGAGAKFAYPQGIAVDGSGNVYVADKNNHTIRRITPGGTASTYAGAAGVSGATDGASGAARFNTPTDVAVDSDGSVYVADSGNHTIRKISPGGVVSTFAGASGASGSGNGVGGSARFDFPQSVTVDATGNVFVADTNNNTIRKITPAGSVSTFAGAAGQFGSNDGTGAGARFYAPYAVEADAAGNVYVADFNNAIIRKISPAGVVSLFAGVPGRAGMVNGAGATARFNQPYALTVAANGTVYVADTYNRAIRRISTGGDTFTVDGIAARFYYPQGIAVDASGNLYVADGDNQAILKGVAIVTPTPTTPASQTAAAGGSATFTVSGGSSFDNYQWQISTDGATWANLGNTGTYSGVTTSSLTVANVSSGMSGHRFRAVLSNSAGATASGAATLTVSAGPAPGPGTGNLRLINLSARAFVGSGDPNGLFLGLVSTGSAPKNVLFRAAGPAIAAMGVNGTLAQPQIRINSNSAVIGTFGAWDGTQATADLFTSLGAFQFARNPNSADSAVHMQGLSTGTYTGIVTGVGGGTGVALAEIYDNDSSGSKFINLSARAFVGGGENVLIGGFVIGGGDGSGTKRVLIRGLGPALTPQGVSNALPATKITVVRSGTSDIVGTNQGWSSGNATNADFGNVGASALPAGSGDSAIILTLTSGGYTVVVEGAGGAQGNGLVEIFEY